MRNIYRIFCVVFATATVCAQTPMKYDNFTHQVLKPPVSAGSIYDYDFTGLSIHGIGGGGTPGGTTGQFQFNNGGGTFGGMPTINTTGGAAVIIDADNVIFDQSGAATKKFHFNGVNVTAGTNRAVNIPDATSTAVIPDAGAANNVLTGINTSGVITKAPVTDDLGALLVKPDSAAVSTSNIASLSGIPSSIDGIPVASSGIVLLTAQSTGSQNGFWTVHAGAWTRPLWYASGNTAQALPSMATSIQGGVVYSGSRWYCTNTGGITIDTTTTTWANANTSINASTVYPGVTGTGKVVLDASPTITGHETIEGVTATGATGTGKFVFDTSPTISGHETIEGVTATGATGTGKFVFDSTPTLNSPVISGGLTANGSAANDFSGSSGTFLTSTGANTLKGTVTITPPVRTSGSAAYFTLNPPADTGQTANVESVGYQHSNVTRTWVDGTVALQRENVFNGPTYAKTTTSATFTDAFTLYATPPTAAAGVTITRPHSFGILDGTSASSSITGGLVVSTTTGTTATSVGIGGGNINAGGTGTFGGALTAATINGNTITTGTGTLTLGAGKTTTFDHTSTFTTTDGQTYTFPATTATLARIDAANTFVGASTGTSWTMTTPVIAGGLTASGSGANTFAGSTGTFVTSTGANTLSANTTISGTTTITPAARSSGVAEYFTLNIPADTAQTAATEAIGYHHVTATRQWATTGTVALQRENYLAGPTYSSASASQTFTDACTLYIDKPLVGTNAIFTRAHSLAIVDSTTSTTGTTGALVVATTLGTAGTAVGIGAGNVTAGNNIKANGALISSLGVQGTTATGIFDFNQANQSQVVVSGTEYYLTNSNLNMPATYSTAIGAGTTMKWRLAINKTAAGTGTFQILLKKGTNGTTADATMATITVGTQTGVADNMECDVTVTFTSTTAMYYSVIPHQSAASGTGFGLVYPAVAAQFNGTVGSLTTTTASDKYGLSVLFTTGTPTFTVPMMQAQAFGVD